MCLFLFWFRFFFSLSHWKYAMYGYYIFVVHCCHCTMQFCCLIQAKTHCNNKLLKSQTVFAQRITWQHPRCCRLAHWFQPAAVVYIYIYVHTHTQVLYVSYECYSLYNNNKPLNFHARWYICNANWYFNAHLVVICMLLLLFYYFLIHLYSAVCYCCCLKLNVNK